MQTEFAIIIPARYQSSRFPGKPLAEIAGISMIRRVWRQCVNAHPCEQVFVATDSELIREHCEEFGIQILMTSSVCLTGTDRVCEAARQINARTIINVQGDEPLIDPEDIKLVMRSSRDNPGKIINAMCKIRDEQDYRSSTVPKVVFAPNGRLIYMSRGAIPSNKEFVFRKAWKQVCIYAFPLDALEKFSTVTEKTPLESEEDIEILRFIEMGYDVSMIEVSESSVAVDVPSDITRVEELIDG